MEKRTVGIVATAITALCCGCPGLFSLCWGAIAAIASFMPGAEINIGGSSDPTTALWTGIGACCGGIIFVAIPIAVGFVMLRNKAADPAVTGNNEPPQPTSSV